MLIFFLAILSKLVGFRLFCFLYFSGNRDQNHVLMNFHFCSRAVFHEKSDSIKIYKTPLNSYRKHVLFGDTQNMVSAARPKKVNRIPAMEVYSLSTVKLILKLLTTGSL